MSEISSYRTKIRIPSLAQRTTLEVSMIDQEPRFALLRRALELVAQDHDGKVVSRIVDCDGKEIQCLIGVKTRECPGGVGVTVGKSGEVSFVYDAYGDEEGWGKRIAGEISSNYNAIAVRLALQAMNMEVQVRESRSGHGGRLIELEGRF